MAKRIQRWLVLAVALVMLGAPSMTVSNGLARQATTPSATPLAPAPATEKMHAWIDLSGTTPAAGCDVTMSIEMRIEGVPLSNIEVTVGLFEGNDLVALDRSATNDDGATWLTVNTVGVTQGRLQINVGPHALKSYDIVTADGNACESGALFDELDAQLPVNAFERAENAPEFITYQQERGLSCEYASVQIVTSYWGDPISEYALDDVIGLSPNPHWGYRGDITGAWGNTTNYGVYALPFTWALPQFGYVGEAFYGDGDATALKEWISNGVPVVVWVAMWGDLSFKDSLDGSKFTLVPGMHVMVAYHYTDEGVFLSDPGTAHLRFYSWPDFMSMWNVLDGMALAVHPA
jgi:uncharacterized protein YvpB